MGTQVGQSDYVIGLATAETNIVFTSPKLVSPSSVHYVITAVTRAGAHATYKETIYLLLTLAEQYTTGCALAPIKRARHFIFKKKFK